MAEPADVGLEEGPQIRHAVFQHGNAVDPHAPGKALILIRIKPAIADDIAVDHAAAENFEPVVALAEADFTALARALDVDFHRGFGEGEKRRPEAHLDVIDLEERLAEFRQDPFQMAHMRAFVDHQTLDLMEHRRMGLVRVTAIGAARNDHPDRRFLAHHGADLHRTGMGAQHLALAIRIGLEEKRIVHFTRRMAEREIQRGEIIKIGLDIRPLGHRKAHIGEDGGQFVDHLRDRMDPPARGQTFGQRQRHIGPLGLQPCIQRRIAQCRAPGGQGGGHAVTQAVDQRTLLLALVRRHAAQRFQQTGNRARFAQSGNAHRFQSRFIARSRNRRCQIMFQCRKITHAWPAKTAQNARKSIDAGLCHTWGQVSRWQRD